MFLGGPLLGRALYPLALDEERERREMEGWLVSDHPLAPSVAKALACPIIHSMRIADHI